MKMNFLKNVILSASIGFMPCVLASTSPSELGQYSIGYQTLYSVQTKQGLVTNVSVWYPVSDQSECSASAAYPTAALGFGAFYDLPSPNGYLTGEQCMPSAGQHPVFIYDHGGGFDRSDSARFESMHIAEHLASHGFIAIAFNQGNSSANRARDMRDILNIVLANDRFSSVADPNKVVTAGHSAGGRTSLSLAGGDGIDDTLPDSHSRIVAAVGYDTALGSSSSSVTPKVKNINVPVLMMGGPYLQAAGFKVFAKSTGSPKVKVYLPQAAHLSFGTFLCDDIKANRDLSLGNGFAGEPLAGPSDDPNAYYAWFNWNVYLIFGSQKTFGAGRQFCHSIEVADEYKDFTPQYQQQEDVIEILKYFTTAFLKAYVMDESEYEKYLEPTEYHKYFDANDVSATMQK